MVTKHVANLVPLELVGLNGNALVLMGTFKRAARQAGTPSTEIEAVLADCMSGDYNHLVATLMENTVSPDSGEK